MYLSKGLECYHPQIPTLHTGFHMLLVGWRPECCDWASICKTTLCGYAAVKFCFLLRESDV